MIQIDFPYKDNAWAVRADYYKTGEKWAHKLIRVCLDGGIYIDFKGWGIAHARELHKKLTNALAQADIDYAKEDENEKTKGSSQTVVNE